VISETSPTGIQAISEVPHGSILRLTGLQSLIRAGQPIGADDTKLGRLIDRYGGMKGCCSEGP